MPVLPSKEEIAFMKAHEDQSLVPGIIACVVICSIASILFFILRLYSQYLVSRKFCLTQSDILLLIGLVFNILVNIGFGMAAKYGAGRHITAVTDLRLLSLWKITAEMAYYLSLLFIKLGILRLYGTIFPSRTFRTLLWIFALLFITFHLVAIIVVILECIPIEYSWDMTIQGGHCVNSGLYTFLAGIFNIITEFMILLSPIPYVLRLNTSKQKKMLLVFTFGMGGSACIVSVVRLAFAFEFDSTSDSSYDNIPFCLLAVVELMTGILAASIPTYRPFFRRIMNTDSQHLITSPKNTDSRGSKSNSGGGIGIGPQISGGTPSGQLERDFPGINVTSHIELARYTNMGGNWIRVHELHEG
ncbi:hypothetical protein F4774DRAFT_425801 [Daldinia eschscholtzii]|nr:hypothetical protein F4774DRAFT_425801 [Daldinia eschscholtzii]